MSGFPPFVEEKLSRILTRFQPAFYEICLFFIAQMAVHWQLDRTTNWSTSGSFRDISSTLTYLRIWQPRTKLILGKKRKAKFPLNLCVPSHKTSWDILLDVQVNVTHSCCMAFLNAEEIITLLGFFWQNLSKTCCILKLLSIFLYNLALFEIGYATCNSSQT